MLTRNLFALDPLALATAFAFWGRLPLSGVLRASGLQPFLPIISLSQVQPSCDGGTSFWLESTVAFFATSYHLTLSTRLLQIVPSILSSLYTTWPLLPHALSLPSSSHTYLLRRCFVRSGDRPNSDWVAFRLRVLSSCRLAVPYHGDRWLLSFAQPPRLPVVCRGGCYLLSEVLFVITIITAALYVFGRRWEEGVRRCFYGERIARCYVCGADSISFSFSLTLSLSLSPLALARSHKLRLCFPT